MGRTTSLRSLRLSTYPNIPEFNIPNVIYQLFNLRKLWIDAPEPHKVKSTNGIVGPTSSKTIIASDLRNEMSGRLPHKLREITIGGKGFTTISDSILKVIFNKRNKFLLCL